MKIKFFGALLIGLCACNLASGATIPFVEDFDDNLAPDFTTQLSVNSTVYTATTNRWSLPGSGALKLAVPSGPVAPDNVATRHIALAQITDAYDQLSAGVPITTSVQLRASAVGSTSHEVGGLAAFLDNSTAGGTSASFFGTHGWVARFTGTNIFSILQNNSGVGTLLGVTEAATDGQFTFSTTETYSLSLTTQLITAGPDIGKVQLTFSVFDPDASSVVGAQPNTFSIARVSTGLAHIEVNGDERFGVYARSSSSSAQSTLTVDYDNFSVVPEPSTYLLSGLGLIGLAFIRSRQQK